MRFRVIVGAARVKTNEKQMGKEIQHEMAAGVIQGTFSIGVWVVLYNRYITATGGYHL